MTDKFVNDKVVCVAPWNAILINNRGVSYCDSSSFHYDTADIIKWWQSGADILDVRNKIQLGKEVSGCTRCYDADIKNGTSFRTRKNFQSAIHRGKWAFHSLVQSPAFDRMNRLEVDGYPKVLTIAFSNLCNSRCIMCSARSSNLIAADQNIDPPLKKIPEEHLAQLKLLVEKNKDLESIDINGGEPLLQKECIDFLNVLIDNNLTDVKLSLHINGTVWDNKFTTLLKHFTQLRLAISIETAHPSNNYIRLGSEITQVLNVITQVKTQLADTAEIYLHCVPQALSVFYIDTLFDYCISHKLNLMGNPLFDPAHFRIDVLPTKIKHTLADYLKSKYSIDYNKLTSESHNNYSSNQDLIPVSVMSVINKTIECLLYPEPSNINQMRIDFYKHLETFDVLHNLNYRTYFPDL